MVKTLQKYNVLVGVDNDLTGKRFEPGDTITEKDFDADIIEGWIMIGVIEIKEARSYGGSKKRKG